MPTLAENSLANSAFIDLLDGSHLEKQAIDLVNDYTQLKVRVEVEVLAMGGSLASGGARQDVGA